MNKIFIIGLPRTATTSVCCAMLDLGFTVAHTAYTKKAFEQAQVIADTPVFNDYQLLDQQYPNSKFIYLSRDLSLWLPSIKQLLNRMFINLTRTDGGFNPSLKRCYQDVFSPLSVENINSEQFLQQCFKRHKQQVFQYFENRPQDFLSIDVNQQGAYQALCNFLKVDNIKNSFDVINVGGKVTAWKNIKHSLKVESTKAGKIDLF